jgi:hypothetical protein
LIWEKRNNRGVDVNYLTKNKVKDNVSKSRDNSLRLAFKIGRNKMIDKEELKKLCIKFDRKAGNYPESRFQGYALYEFFLEQLGELNPIAIDALMRNFSTEAEIIAKQYREIEENYLKELRE